MAGPKPLTLQQQVQQLQQRVNQQDTDRDRDRKRDLAEINVHIFENKVLARAERWLITARNIGSAYTRAAKNHRDALAGEDKNKALKTQILYSVLTVLSTGTLSWVWEAGNLARIGKLLGPTLKDTFSAGLGEGFSANGPMYDPPEPSRDAVSQEPQEFQNELENKISAFKISAHDYIAKVYDYIRTAPPESWTAMQVSELQKMSDSWMRQASQAGVLPVAAAQDQTVEAMAREIERGFWQKWIFGLDNAVQISPFGDPNPLIQHDYESISSGGPVAARLKDLGILQEAGVEIKWYHEAIEEDRPLIEWARNKYQPHPFTAE